MSIGDLKVAEGNAGSSTVTITVKLSVPSARPVSASYATSNGTATASTDFMPSSGTITFNPGETSKTISVTILGDFDGENDETFTVTLTNPVNGSLGKATATATIENDDTSPGAQGDTYSVPAGQTLSVTAGPGRRPACSPTTRPARKPSRSARSAA
jgi:hypothetical protein